MLRVFQKIVLIASVASIAIGFPLLSAAQTDLLGAQGILRAQQMIEFLAAAPGTRADRTVSEQAKRGIAGVRSGGRASQPPLVNRVLQSNRQGILNTRTTSAQQTTIQSRRFPTRIAGGRAQISFQNIEFNTGSFSIPATAYTQLDEIGVALSTLLEQFPSMQFVIEGHVDILGDAINSKSLSFHRANAIKRFLVARFAIDGSRLAVEGLGKDQPLASNKLHSGRALNRIHLVRII